MFCLKERKRKIYVKFYCLIGIFILTIIGLILLKVSEDKNLSYDISNLDEVRNDDKVYIETDSDPVRFYLNDENSQNIANSDYYYTIKNNEIYIFVTDKNDFENFLEDDYYNNKFKKKDNSILIFGYTRKMSENIFEGFKNYSFENGLDVNSYKVNSYMINTKIYFGSDKSEVYDFLLNILIFIGLPLYLTYKNYKAFRKSVKDIDLDNLEEELVTEPSNFLYVPFVLTKNYFIIFDESFLSGGHILGRRNLQTIGNTFGIFKYTDIKHMVIEENRVTSGGEYYILYIVLNDNRCITYRSKVGEDRTKYDDVVKICLEKNPNIKNDAEDKDYAKSFIIKYFKRVFYVIYLLMLWLLYCIFVLLFVSILFD